MRLTVRHRTEYSYSQPRRTVVQSLRLTPSRFAGQFATRWSVTVEGAEAERGASFRDGAGDWIETVALRNVDHLVIVAEGEVETSDTAGVLKGLREKISPHAYLRRTDLTTPDLAVRELGQEAVSGIGTPLDQAHALSHAVRDAVSYTPGMTEHGTSAAEALAAGHGVCQDQTHVLISAARSVGLPARYVTGYLQATADGSAEQASHAWAELHVDGLGWVGFDAANGCCPDERYIRLGSGLDAVAAAPIRGTGFGAGTEDLRAEVTVDAQQ
ncbi:transglutaminase family protein [Palleronia caenipelagi]|uniref:Transglutaminase family protein n=1 Tax=Palleronia caenipelagi TaxID=2489174 RepID=A0A547Q5A5_9RHOB|nr:transglutaminase family protein [Palleronia caenipelagi]TRD21527.1 transglutaminase family protein [Palleronia caenipelagi]